MKKNYIVLVLSALTFLVVGCKKENAIAKSTEKTEKKIAINAKPETANLEVEGMTCKMGCAKTIEEKLTVTDGVEKASVDFDKKLATIKYDGSVTDLTKLKSTIEGCADGKTYKVLAGK